MESYKLRIDFRISIIFIFIILGACVNTTKYSTTPFLESTNTLEATLNVPNRTLCLSIPVAPTPGPNEKSIFPKADQYDHLRGPSDADVTFIEYGDFQCPGCAGLAPVLLLLAEEFPKELRVVFRQLPLYDIHNKALLAAQASEAASDLGKFWEMHDFLFGKYDDWKSMSQEEFSSWLEEQAPTLGLDKTKFIELLTSQVVVNRVENDLEQGLEIGLRTTPFLLINGQMYDGPRDHKSLEQIVRLIVLGKRQFTTCPEMTIDPLKQYIAILHTEKGDITIQLFPDKAPMAVNSFVFLARNGWYNNIRFYRVIPGLIVQTGDPSGTGLGGPGYFFNIETDKNMVFDRPGLVAMMNSGLDTNGSQFFINLAPQMDLNERYTIFGQVIAGMDVLAKLSPRNPEKDLDQSLPGDLLINISISEN